VFLELMILNAIHSLGSSSHQSDRTERVERSPQRLTHGATCPCSRLQPYGLAHCAEGICFRCADCGTQYTTASQKLILQRLCSHSRTRPTFDRMECPDCGSFFALAYKPPEKP
jgi:hypothetical protein